MYHKSKLAIDHFLPKLKPQISNVNSVYEKSQQLMSIELLVKENEVKFFPTTKEKSSSKHDMSLGIAKVDGGCLSLFEMNKVQWCNCGGWKFYM